MPIKPGRKRISLTLTDDQLAVIETAAGTDTTRTAVILDALKVYFGDAWPDDDLSWGGFSQEARNARWKPPDNPPTE